MNNNNALMLQALDLYDEVSYGLKLDKNTKLYSYKSEKLKIPKIEVSEILNPRYTILDPKTGNKLTSVGGFDDVYVYIREQQYPMVDLRVRGSVRIKYPHETTIDVDVTDAALYSMSLLDTAVCKYIVEYHMFK